MKRNFGFVAIGVVVMLALVLTASTATAALITYVDAVGWDSHGAEFINTTYSDGTPVVFGSTVNDASDGLWAKSSIGHAGQNFHAHNNEDAPELKTTISDLTPGASYNVYAYFMSPYEWSQNDDLAVGLTSGSLAKWNVLGSDGMNDAPILAKYDHDGLPVPAADSLGVEYFVDPYPNRKFNAVNDYFNDTPVDFYGDDNVIIRRLGYAGDYKYEASVGVAVADGSGEIAVYVDDAGSGWRTKYDGVGYSIIPEPSSLVLFGLASLMGLVARRRRS